MFHEPEKSPDTYPGGKTPPSPDKPPLPPVEGPVETNPDARNMAMLCHLLGALLGIFGPLIVWMIKKDEYAYVDQQGKEALNFHITLLIAYVVSSIAWVVISFVTCGFGAFVFLPGVVGIAQVICGILAAIETSQGKPYEYPFNYRWIQ